MPENPKAIFYAYEDYEVAMFAHASEYVTVLSHIEDYVRKKYKYGHEYASIEAALEDIMETIGNFKIEYHLPEEG